LYFSIFPEKCRKNSKIHLTLSQNIDEKLMKYEGQICEEFLQGNFFKHKDDTRGRDLETRGKQIT
jgi:hypothetical protein